MEWGDTSNNQLREAVGRCGGSFKKQGRINWAMVVNLMGEGFTNESCRARWNKLRGNA
jgi:hypothetical protein